jgi:TRAP-type mannitol/chloroaromatic compound transport system permease small subunit
MVSAIRGDFFSMTRLLSLSRAIDAANTAIGRTAAWLILVVSVVAVAHAVLGKVFGAGASSNAWLETQWLMFSAVFLLAAPWTLLSNEHIRIDILNHRLSPRTRLWIDAAGHTLFLMPMAAILLWTSLPFALTSLAQREGSSNAGGLPQWPLKMLIPLAFALLLAQGLSELIKTLARLRGDLADPAVPATASHPQDI